ncbi:TRAP transporter large permease [Vibrio nigripulchritudo]|uniref:TRAP transporter large permease n=1 Tax=Vibrio nigripulchritudo TaxID=28173 RepID=UPI0005F9A9C3|nr:TRAP transporter large permease subunit [Vibrio nigripulchritudo]KJY68998.1 C4-dicarboxylate ABC transporter [Vibrio nigripulchritudo]
MEINEILILAMFGSFILLLFLGIPVAWVLGGIGIIFAGIAYYSDIYLDTVTGLDFQTLGLLVNRLYKIMDNWILVALPMFIFMGNMLDKSGVADRLMLSMQAMFGKVHGGLAITVVSIGIILAASTGIIGASVVLLAMMALPSMLKQGYNKPLVLGTIASAGCLGILIPPSIMLVIMADQLGLSVGDLFMAAVFPGLALGSMYILYLLAYGMFRPKSLPLPDTAERVSFAIVWQVIKAVIPTLLLIVAVLGSIFAGIATPTEASGVGAAGATLLAIYYRKFSLAILKEVTLESYKTTAYIFAIFIGATCFSLVLRELGGDEFIESLFQQLPFGPYGIVAFILLMVFLLGFFLDWIEITLIILPLLAPVVAGLDLNIGEFAGIDDSTTVWFVMLVAMTLQTSFLTPPVGFALFYLKGVCPPEIKLSEIYKGVVPFIILQLIALLLILFWPSVALWLPSVAYN